MYKYHSSLGNTKIQCPPSYDLVLSCTSVLPNILKMEKLTIQGKYKILKLLPLKHVTLCQKQYNMYVEEDFTISSINKGFTIPVMLVCLNAVSLWT